MTESPEGLPARQTPGPAPASGAAPVVANQRQDDALTERRHLPRGRWGLILGALGIVFGDIGTSPLYSMQTVFGVEHVEPTPGDILGVISMVIWAVTIVVSIKYVALVMRADNDSEGGILALVALLRHRLSKHRFLAGFTVLMGILGAGLFYGDSLITPAISVMSAVEGLQVINPGFGELVLPISVVILTVLFVVQRWGTGTVGKAFGPIMLVWFATIAVLGVPHIIQYPDILRAISPTYALAFLVDRPVVAFIALGAVVLAITGAEALYADMGHFGAGPIRVSWFTFVFPALLLNYLGQGALVMHDPSTIDNPFFHMAPSWATLPLVLLATLATVIASQAVIAGAFSVSRQAARLGLLPRLTVKHTSRQEGGQIYLPTINWILFFGVLLLIAVFQSSANLANAYGLAVTGTLVLTTTLFLLYARTVWGWPAWKLVPVGLLIGGLELVFLGANLVKFIHGGWLPVVIAAAVIVVMLTWRKGYAETAVRRAAIEGPLDDFVQYLHDESIPRVPGCAVFPHPQRITTPLALRSNVEFNRVLHETVLIISITNEAVPHIRHVDRVSVHDLGFADDGIVHVNVRVGFNDSQDIPKALALALGKSDELDFDLDEVRYFLSRFNLVLEDRPPIWAWRKRMFVWLARNAGNRTAVFHLPPERTIVIGSEVPL